MGSIRIDFVGLNTLIYDPIIVSGSGLERTASIGYSPLQPAKTYRNQSIGVLAPALSLAAINLHRNGPYGYPTFKQVRNVDKPIVRHYRENSIFPYLSSGEVYNVATEPAVVFRNKPLQYNVNLLPEGGGLVDIVNKKIDISYNNNLTFFANEQTDIDHDVNIISYTNNEIYTKFKQLYIDQDAQTFISTFNELKYERTLYPADKNNIGDVRGRPTFSNTFWRDYREDRKKNGDDVLKNFGFALTQSMWDLDPEEGFLTITTSFLPADVATSGAGNLQNSQTHVHGLTNINLTNVTMFPRALYSLKHTLPGTASVVGAGGMYIPETGSLITPGNLFGGSALWQAGDQAGFFTSRLTRSLGDAGTVLTFNSASKLPFYDSYSEYSDIIKFKAKGYTAIPEYRISENYQRLSPPSFDRRTNNDQQAESLFSLTGGIGTLRASSQDGFYSIYSFSDLFGDDLIKVLDDHNGYAIPSKLKLKAHGILKLLPYQGFYPAERTVQLAEQFKNSFAGAVSSSGKPYTEEIGFRPLLNTFYSPGIMYNTIKSGMAVDFPIFSGTFDITGAANSQGLSWLIKSSQNYSDANGFHRRIPFEALLNPNFYLDAQPIVDMFAHPSASLSVTSSLNAAKANDQKYRLMVENFFAEVPNFFLANRSFTNIRSSGDDEFELVSPTKTYGMRVKMFRSMTGSRIEEQSPSIPQDLLAEHSARKETFTMYSRPTAFGPPSIGAYGNPRTDSRAGYNFPFTPPYYHGEAYADILYTPSGDSAVQTPTLDDIFSSSVVHYYRVHTGSTTVWPSGDGLQAKQRVNLNALQMSASLNLFGNDSIQPVIIGGRTTPTTNAKQWVISPKFETPMLNFRHVSASIPGICRESTPRGMWHQFGRIPNDADTGVFVTVEDIPTDWSNDYYTNISDMKSLVDVVGFDRQKTRLGEVAEVKEITEALLVIPFVEKSGDREFVSIERGRINTALGNATALFQAGDSITTMINSMQKYYLPPEFDFLSDTEIEPFVMYFLEFSHKLSKQDLVDIWQNLPPKIGRQFETQEVEFEQEINSTELLGNLLTTSGNKNSLSMRNTLQKLRFMVLKVKRKAETSYGDKVYTNLASYKPELISEARMNWPYDFFSLVEFAKLDVGLTFSKPNDQQAQDQDETSGLPSRGSTTSVISQTTTPAQTAGIATGAEDLGFTDTTRLVGTGQQQADTTLLTGEGVAGTTTRGTTADYGTGTASDPAAGGSTARGSGAGSRTGGTGGGGGR
jgi:hypothetical protein